MSLRDLVNGVKNRLTTKAKGSTGVINSGGTYENNDIDKLVFPENYDTYNDMRRKDEKVSSLLNMVKNPIKKANWYIEPVDNSEEEKKISDLMNHIVFENIGSKTKFKTWKEFLNESLTMIDFGHSVFEVVHKVVIEDKNFGTYIGLKDLGFRRQDSIEEWNLRKEDGSLENIRQLVYSGDESRDVTIPGENLFVLSYNKEGDDYQGQSELRSLYRNYLIKNRLRKYQAIGYERSNTGIPLAKVPNGAENTGQQAKLEDILKRFTSNESNYLIAPKGWDIENFKLSNENDKIEETIKSLDEGMTKRFLATFIDLGTGGNGGAYALATDLSDLFLSGIEVYADYFSEMFNRIILKKLVKINFGEREVYPKLKYSGINDKKGKEYAEIISMLKGSGLIKIDDRTLDYINSIYNLPEVEEESQNDKADETNETQTETNDTDIVDKEENIDDNQQKFNLIIKNKRNKKNAMDSKKSSKRS